MLVQRHVRTRRLVLQCHVTVVNTLQTMFACPVLAALPIVQSMYLSVETAPSVRTRLRLVLAIAKYVTRQQLRVNGHAMMSLVVLVMVHRHSMSPVVPLLVLRPLPLHLRDPSLLLPLDCCLHCSRFIYMSHPSIPPTLFRPSRPYSVAIVYISYIL